MEKTEIAEPTLGRASIIVIACAAGLTFSAIPLIFGSIGVLVGPLQDDFGVSRGAVNLAITAFVFGLIAGSPVAGRLADRWGTRRVILISTLAIGGTLYLMPLFVERIEHLYVAYFLIALFGAGASPVTYSKIIAGHFLARRGLALGLALSGVGLGTALVPLAADALVQNEGWRAAPRAAGLAMLFALLPLLFLLLPRVDAGGTGTESSSGLAELAGTFGSPIFRTMALAFLLVGIGYTGMATQLVPLLIDRGLTPGDAAAMQAVLGGTVIVGRLVSGWLLDRMQAWLIAAVAMTATAAGVAVLVFLPYGPWTILGIGLLGLSAGAEVDVMAYMTARFFSLEGYGLRYGTLNSLYFVGTAIGPVAAAASFDATGNYLAAGTGLSIALLLAAIVIGRLRSASPQSGSPT